METDNKKTFLQRYANLVKQTGCAFVPIKINYTLTDWRLDMEVKVIGSPKENKDEDS